MGTKEGFRQSYQKFRQRAEVKWLRGPFAKIVSIDPFTRLFSIEQAMVETLQPHGWDEWRLPAKLEGVIAEHPGPVADVRAGKDKAVAFLIGQVMKKTRGRANPEMVNRLLRDRIGAG